MELMAVKASPPPVGPLAQGSPDADRIRLQLDRMLQSRSFNTVDRLKRFLLFVVDETLRGRGNQLKEFVVGSHVFGKESSFDPRRDPIVRVQARRLRARLARYYQEEGQSDRIVIELPKGGYAPVFREREVTTTQKRHPLAVLAARNSVTVRPFADLTQEQDQTYLCRSLEQEIITTLIKTELARVVSSDAMFGSRATDAPGAAVVVAGSLQKVRGNLRVTLQLIEGDTGVFLWSDSIMFTEQDPFDIQQAVAETILRHIHGGLTENRWRRQHRGAENLAAYNLLQQARYQLSQRTEESLSKAVELFDKVLIEDPHSSAAYAGLADSYSLLGHYGVMAPVEVWNKVASNAASAILEDDNSAEAHACLAHAKATQNWDWSAAEIEFRLAIQIDPRYATAHHWYAMSCLAPAARLDEALDEIQLAQALDPISSIIIRDVAVIYYYRREFEEALEQCDHTLELNPHFSPAYWTLGLIQEQLGDFEESAAAFDRALQLAPRNPRITAALGRTLALSGKEDQAREILAGLHNLAAKRYVSPYNLASVHFALGEKPEGYKWLREASRDRCFEMISLSVNPQFDALRREPEFLEIVHKLGLC